MKKYLPEEDEILKKQLAQIDRNFKRSVLLLIICAVIAIIIILNYF